MKKLLSESLMELLANLQPKVVAPVNGDLLFASGCTCFGGCGADCTGDCANSCSGYCYTSCDHTSR